MTLPEAMTQIVDIVRNAVEAKTWFYGRPRTNPSMWPSVICIYSSSDPKAGGSSTRSAAGRLQRNSRTRKHGGVLYIAVGEVVQEGSEQKLHAIAQKVMDAFDGDETLRGTGDRDLVAKFTLGTLITFNLPIVENGAPVLGLQAPFEIFETLNGPAPEL